MARIFKEILVQVVPEPDAHELVDCLNEMREIFDELGEGHGYAVFSQVFGHTENRTQFYLTGKILTPDQALRIKQILSET